MINDNKINLQLEAASGITLISRKTRRTNHIARNASNDGLKLENKLNCQVCCGDQPVTAKCKLTKLRLY